MKNKYCCKNLSGEHEFGGCESCEYKNDFDKCVNELTIALDVYEDISESNLPWDLYADDIEDRISKALEETKSEREEEEAAIKKLMEFNACRKQEQETGSDNLMFKYFMIVIVITAIYSLITGQEFKIHL